MADWKSKAVNYGVSVAGVLLAIFIAVIESFGGPLLSTNQLIATYASLLFIQIAIVLNRSLESLSPVVSYVENRAITEPIWESDFYNRFRSDVQTSEQRVHISYFDNSDPRQSHTTRTANYYEEIGDIISDKTAEDVKFRRIIRGVPQLESWVDDLLEERQGNGNYSLACILDEEPEEDLKSHVAVQLIDDDIVYFVAIGEQQESNNPRDIRVESKELNEQWQRYYDRIWDDSCVLMRRGEINQGNLAQYRSHINRLSDD
ncbi:hypothetical protein [Halobaculum sp. P14]|uniref:hypothetical protein n=1 Tax=Halobaculum sp. P14 TaxID=3421638 RepID=UPI003EBD8DD9